jgi:hypothetical protein
VIARTLSRRIVVRTSDRTAFEAIRYLACDPEIVGVRQETSVVTVEPFRGRYLVSEEDRSPVEVIGLVALIDHLSSRVVSLSLQAKPTAGIFHAALLRCRDRKVLITGREAAGKTTLAMRLVQAGYELEGDENVFLDQDGVIARPRGCRVKESSLAFLPAMAEAIAKAPAYVDYFGRKIFNVDPRIVGGTWRIEKGKVDRIIVLQPNHGGYSSLRRMQPLALSQALLSEFGLRESGRSASIGAVARLAGTCQGFDLSLGDHETAIKCIDRALDDEETPST